MEREGRVSTDMTHIPTWEEQDKAAQDSTGDRPRLPARGGHWGPCQTHFQIPGVRQ